MINRDLMILFSEKEIVSNFESEQKDAEQGITTMEFSLPLTQDLQNKQVFFGVKVNIGGTESIQYSQGIDIGTVGALRQP